MSIDRLVLFEEYVRLVKEARSRVRRCVEIQEELGLSDGVFHELIAPDGLVPGNGSAKKVARKRVKILEPGRPSRSIVHAAGSRKGKALSKALRAHRKSEGLSQKGIAEALGVSPAAIANLECGRSGFTVGMLESLATVGIL